MKKSKIILFSIILCVMIACAQPVLAMDKPEINTYKKPTTISELYLQIPTKLCIPLNSFVSKTNEYLKACYNPTSSNTQISGFQNDINLKRQLFCKEASKASYDDNTKTAISRVIDLYIPKHDKYLQDIAQSLKDALDDQSYSPKMIVRTINPQPQQFFSNLSAAQKQPFSDFIHKSLDIRYEQNKLFNPQTSNNKKTEPSSNFDLFASVKPLKHRSLLEIIEDEYPAEILKLIPVVMELFKAEDPVLSLILPLIAYRNKQHEKELLTYTHMISTGHTGQFISLLKHAAELNFNYYNPYNDQPFDQKNIKNLTTAIRIIIKPKHYNEDGKLLGDDLNPNDVYYTDETSDIAYLIRNTFFSPLKNRLLPHYNQINQFLDENLVEQTKEIYTPDLLYANLNKKQTEQLYRMIEGIQHLVSLHPESNDLRRWGGYINYIRSLRNLIATEISDIAQNSEMRANLLTVKKILQEPTHPAAIPFIHQIHTIEALVEDEAILRVLLSDENHESYSLMKAILTKDIPLHIAAKILSALPDFTAMTSNNMKEFVTNKDLFQGYPDKKSVAAIASLQYLLMQLYGDVTKEEPFYENLERAFRDGIEFLLNSNPINEQAKKEKLENIAEICSLLAKNSK